MTIELSKESLNNAIKYLNKFQEDYKKGVENAIKRATEMMYEKVKGYCYDNGIQNHTDNIFMEYDYNTKVGKVWTSDMVIIFNEMGTGITGANQSHPNPSSDFKSWQYDVNNHGEKGWKYPKEDGTYGWTKGLPSRHMFFDAFENIKKEIGSIVNVEIKKTVGDLY